MKSISASDILAKMKRRSPIAKAVTRIKPQVIGNKKRKAARLKHQQEISNE